MSPLKQRIRWRADLREILVPWAARCLNWTLALLAIGAAIQTWAAVNSINLGALPWPLLPAMLVAIPLAMSSSALSIFAFFSILQSITLLPFGGRFALVGARFHISAEATPPGKWCLVQLDASDGRWEEMEGLQHRTHTDPQALSILSEWLHEHTNAHASPGESEFLGKLAL